MEAVETTAAKTNKADMAVAVIAVRTAVRTAVRSTVGPKKVVLADLL
jgi:hypothetical protein